MPSPFSSPAVRYSVSGLILFYVRGKLQFFAMKVEGELNLLIGTGGRRETAGKQLVKVPGGLVGFLPRR
jgi:hypothetical protein